MRVKDFKACSSVSFDEDEPMTMENQIPATLIEQIEIMIAVGGLSPAQKATFQSAATHIATLEAQLAEVAELPEKWRDIEDEKILDRDGNE